MRKNLLMMLLMLAMASLLVVSCSDDEAEDTGVDCTELGATQCNGETAVQKCDGTAKAMTWMETLCAETEKCTTTDLGSACVPKDVTGDTDPTGDNDPGTDVCGDNAKTGTEICDGDTVDCTTLGTEFSAGTATCKSDCTGYETGTCTPASTGECGNSTKEGTEVCDGDSVDCATLGDFEAGTNATCKADCTGYETSTCTAGAKTRTSLNIQGTVELFHPTNVPAYNGDISDQVPACDALGTVGTPYGSITITLDAEAISMSNQDQAGIIPSHVYSGTYGDAGVIMPQGEFAQSVVGYDSENKMYYVQDASYDADQALMNPIVMLQLKEDAPNGAAAAGLTETDPVTILVGEVDANSGQFSCFHGVGVGNVTLAD